MDLIKREGKKVGPIEDVLHKFNYSFQGFAYCFTHESSFIFESIAIAFAVIFGLFFHITVLQWILSICSILMIMQIELLNTGIEAVVDMFTSEFHPLAKVAKDCGSAATCLTTFIAFFINLIIFIPYFTR